MGAEGNQIQADRERCLEACCEFFRSRNDSRLLAAFACDSVLGAYWRPDSDIDIAVLERDGSSLPWSDQDLLLDELERATRRGIDLRLMKDCEIRHQGKILRSGVLL